MNLTIKKLFTDAQKVFSDIRAANARQGEMRDMLLAILTTPAVETLGDMSLCASEVASNDEALKDQYQNTVQQLIDFLESQGHGNVLKEFESIQRFSPHFPTLRIPKALQFVKDGLHT